MLCENCSRFFEIAEAIRSLGMTILKGSTEACGGKIWICFVAEVYFYYCCNIMIQNIHNYVDEKKFVIFALYILLTYYLQGLNNRNVHRMDILWSLVQILQPKTDV